MQIYLARNQVQAGPYTLEEVNNMLQTREVDLNDLMWHEGMNEWQRVGNLTAETYQYAPNGVSDTPISVNDLYGRASTSPTVEPKKTNNRKTATAKGQFNLNKTSDRTPGVSKLASVSSRVLAIFIDTLLFLACLVPILSHSYKYAATFQAETEQLQSTSETMELAMQLAETIPPTPMHLTIMTTLMLIALVVIQLVLLIKRGQTIGKLATGIRIVDAQTLYLTSVANLLLRTALVSLLYYLTLTFSFVSNMPILFVILLLAELASITIDKRNQSLHDKLVKTIVIKADDRQLNNVKDVKKKSKTLKKK